MASLWAMSIPGLVVLLVVLAALERFALWAGRRSWLPGRGDRTKTTVSGAGIEELGAYSTPASVRNSSIASPNSCYRRARPAAIPGRPVHPAAAEDDER
ncbi:hypothetical protein [Actinophytocola sp.]|uniref:hypothetical protein n=1 Tax=Actinophytocola sp. TaxID=1872138 RepID=UPI003D6AC09F